MNLTAVLRRATDDIESPHLAVAALARARERQARLRASVAAGAAVAGVVAVIGITQSFDRDADDRPVDTVAPTTTPQPPADDRAIGARWDPLTVPAAPLRPSLLPADLAPPELPRNVDDDPMEAAVVAWPEAGHDLRLLGTDGRWRCIEGTDDAVSGQAGGVVRPALTADGTQVAMTTDEGILVVDLTTGAEDVVAWPEELAPPWDTVPALEWLPVEDGFLVHHWPRTWIVELDGGARPAPYGGRYDGGLAVADDGSVIEKRYDVSDLRVWRDGTVDSTAQVPYWGERLAAGFGRVAFTGGGGGLPGDGGPVVIDTATGELVAYLPMRDPDAFYTDNGHLTALGFLDDRTAVLLVGPGGFGPGYESAKQTWHLVAWDLGTGGIERLTTGAEGMRMVEVAVEVLAGG